MKPIALLLDLDGVLITTPTWKMDEIHTDGYSQFNVVCVENLNQILNFGRFEIYISSTRRKNKTIEEFNQIFKNRGISQEIKDFLPLNDDFVSRKEEIQVFLKQTKIEDFLIIDDDKTTLGLPDKFKSRLILTEFLNGLSSENVVLVKALLKNE